MGFQLDLCMCDLFGSTVKSSLVPRPDSYSIGMALTALAHIINPRKAGWRSRDKAKLKQQFEVTLTIDRLLKIHLDC